MIYYKKDSDDIIEYFPRQEADQLGMQYVPWRDADQDTKYVLSDDNYVVKVKRVKYITECIWKPTGATRTRKRVVTELGWRYAHGKIPLNILEHVEAKCTSALVPIVWWKDRMQREPALVRLLAKAVMNHSIHMTYVTKYNREEYKVFIDIAKRLYGDEGSWYKVRSFFNHDEVRMEIQQEIKKIAKERGYDVTKVFDLLDKCEKYADAKMDGKTILALAKEIGALVGMSNRLTNPHDRPQLPLTEDELPGSESTFDRIIQQDADSRS